MQRSVRNEAFLDNFPLYLLSLFNPSFQLIYALLKDMLVCTCVFNHEYLYIKVIYIQELILECIQNQSESLHFEEIIEKL